MQTGSRFAMAVHVMALVAYRDGQRATSEYLAASVNTHPVMIRRLLLALQKGGLIETRRGASFGSRLSRPPEQIHLWSIYRAIDQDRSFRLPPLKANKACPIGGGIEEALRQVFVGAQDALERELSHTTLAEILRSLGNKPQLTAAA